MPAKSMCPQCGQKWRSPAHLCHPNSVRKMARMRADQKAASPSK